MALKTPDASPGQGRAASDSGPPDGSRRVWLRWLWLLPIAGAAILAPRWWRLISHPIAVPATPAAAAREELPRLLAQVRAQPRSVDARMELVACQALLGDRLAAWQQLAIAERLS